MTSTDQKSKSEPLSDTAKAIESFEKGWTDGLPVVRRARGASAPCWMERPWMPRMSRIPWSIETCRSWRKSGDQRRHGRLRPDTCHVFGAALQAMVDPQRGFHGAATSTGGAGVQIVVNGPAARDLDIDSGRGRVRSGLEGQLDHRAGSPFGDAKRGGLPSGTLDRSTVGHPGRYTNGIAENEGESTGLPCTWKGFRPSRAR